MGFSLRCLVRLVDLNVQPYSYKLVCVLLRVHEYLCKWLYSTRYRYLGICVFLNPRLPKVTSRISRASFIKNLGNNFRKKRFLRPSPPSPQFISFLFSHRFFLLFCGQAASLNLVGRHFFIFHVSVFFI